MYENGLMGTLCPPTWLLQYMEMCNHFYPMWNRVKDVNSDQENSWGLLCSMNLMEQKNNLVALTLLTPRPSSRVE